MSTLRLRNCRLLDDGTADITIDDGRISGVLRRSGSDIDAARDVAPHDGTTIDADGRVVLPAFADLHTHLDKVGTFWVDGGEAEEGPDRLQWAADRLRSIKAGLDVDIIAERAEHAIRTLVGRGTTALRTHVDVDTVVELRGIQAMLEVRNRVADIADVQICVLPTEPGWHHRGAGWDLVRAALELEVDAVGGATGFADEPGFYVDTVFGLADEFDVEVDLHVDESDDPTMLVLEHVARRAIEQDRVGRVVAGHCSTLALAEPEDAARIIELVARAGVTVVAMPTTNLYLLGSPSGPRGMTRVRDLLAGGARVACASDNMQDPFNPYGNGDLLQVAALAGAVGHLGAGSTQRALIEAVTDVPRTAMGLQSGLRSGAPADLVVLDTTDPARILADQPARRWVVRSGRVLAEGSGIGGLV